MKNNLWWLVMKKKRWKSLKRFWLWCRIGHVILGVIFRDLSGSLAKINSKSKIRVKPNRVRASMSNSKIRFPRVILKIGCLTMRILNFFWRKSRKPNRKANFKSINRIYGILLRVRLSEGAKSCTKIFWIQKYLKWSRVQNRPMHENFKINS